MRGVRRTPPDGTLRRDRHGRRRVCGPYRHEDDGAQHSVPPPGDGSRANRPHATSAGSPNSWPRPVVSSFFWNQSRKERRSAERVRFGRRRGGCASIARVAWRISAPSTRSQASHVARSVEMQETSRYPSGIPQSSSVEAALAGFDGRRRGCDHRKWTCSAYFATNRLNNRTLDAQRVERIVLVANQAASATKTMHSAGGQGRRPSIATPTPRGGRSGLSWRRVGRGRGGGRCLPGRWGRGGGRGWRGRRGRGTRLARRADVRPCDG